MCPLLPLLQWTNCVKVVLEDKTTFPNLTDVREVVTDQFLCSGTQGDDSPCKGEPLLRPLSIPNPHPGVQIPRGRPLMSLVASMHAMMQR